ncbi:DUF1365 domain-containing protein [Aromatoleum toluolicum]|uniref:DUF1365 domain-containing protein n=1 Tax=Aromatoleum toluolicum TaxID=90060 RepID=UPI001B7CFDB0|nr:DUF1365 domain-containing protein [Aromatoleum toluolicum]NMF96780.2 DUF1365 domain-containing protein [Aromatoleum toluolicum]
MSAAHAPLLPAVCFGAVFHERHAPVHNRFVYPTAFLRLPLSRLGDLSVPLLGVERANVFSFLSRDHGPRDGTPLLPWLSGLLERHGLAGVADGEVVLQTMPRMLGFLFNPVSFWFCHDRAGTLRVVLAEVSNTFGEHHNYLIHHRDRGPIRPGDELCAIKVFHVSPFLPVAGEYRFRFHAEGVAPAVTIDYWEGSERRLSTAVGGRARPLDGRAMLAWLVRYPFMTLAVVVRIHWQALRLWLKRVRFFHKPLPPLEETTR